MRAQCTITLFRLTAFTTRSGPTISITKLWRVGLSIAFTAPRANTSANTIHGSTAPLAASAQSSQRGHHHRHLGHHQQPALVEAVGQQAAEGAEEQDRSELQGGGQRPPPRRCR